jgi:dihydrofolate reductase
MFANRAPSGHSTGVGDVRGLHDYLSSKGLDVYFEALREYGIDSVADLSGLQPSDFDAIGVKPFHRKKLLQVVPHVSQPVTQAPRLHCAVWAAISLDGFVARTDGSPDWVRDATSGADLGATAFLAGVSAVVMGSRSFAGRLQAWPHNKRIVVLSSRPSTEIAVPAELASLVSVVGSIKAALDVLQGEGHSKCAVVGAATIQRFMVGGWIDDITLVLVPRTLLSGIPLLADCALALRKVRDIGVAGCVELYYKPCESRDDGGPRQ